MVSLLCDTCDSQLVAKGDLVPFSVANHEHGLGLEAVDHIRDDPILLQ